MDIFEEMKIKFTAISDSITMLDKEDAESLFSRPTIDKYLAGNIVKLDIAEKLFNFFSEKIQNRVEKMQNENIL